jgi:hypothetical protein
MMMEWVTHVIQIKGREIIWNAEAYQLIQEAAAMRQQHGHLHRRAIAGLGRRLSAWGERLQNQSDAMPLLPVD